MKRVRIPKKMGGEHRGFAFVDFSTAQVRFWLLLCRQHVFVLGTVQATGLCLQKLLHTTMLTDLITCPAIVCHHNPATLHALNAQHVQHIFTTGGGAGDGLAQEHSLIWAPPGAGVGQGGRGKRELVRALQRCWTAWRSKSGRYCTMVVLYIVCVVYITFMWQFGNAVYMQCVRAYMCFPRAKHKM